MKGVDYSWSRPGGAAIKAAGFDFVMRYVDYPGAGAKGLQRAEVDELHANGLAVGIVWETEANRVLAGYGAGVADAQASLAALHALGAPDSMVVYFAVDFDAQPLHYPFIDDYFRGCVSVMGILRVGVYGSFAIVEHCHEVGTAAWFWQTYAWSSGQKSSWRHVYQFSNGETLNGASVDYNEAYGEFGGWFSEEVEMRDEEFQNKFFDLMGKHFPTYLRAALEEVPGKFSDRPDIPMTFPYRPWMADIEAARHTVVLPNVTSEGAQ